ncbi:hypothetical protein BCU98_00515 [Vibrio splendidus]|uniref:RadC family protein n=1 Tax=Vibrio splendidus TaxID=29497 RepID=UPI000C85A7EC|nr:hypothetical protein BCU98_00515 [Vibrio splendidus]
MSTKLYVRIEDPMLIGGFTMREATIDDYASSISTEDKLQLGHTALSETFNKGDAITSPNAMKLYLANKIAKLEREEFGVIFGDNQHRIIAEEVLFTGTVNACNIHPREIIKRSLELNAACIWVYHNHPSGDATPSQADRRITRQLIDALSLMEIRILDHMVVGGNEVVSFAERGWI